MDEKTLKALVDAGALKRIRIIADGSLFHVEADTPNGGHLTLPPGGSEHSGLVLHRLSCRNGSLANED
jgi:hypothetical protein